jgi:hypothetical protein
MIELSLSRLAEFKEEFATFFLGPIETVAGSQCTYCPDRKVVKYSEYESGGWILLRNSKHTYLLIEIRPEQDAWETFFAPDPKSALEHIEEHFQRTQQTQQRIWPKLLPLIRKAHEEAHRDRNPEKQNLTYLADLVAEAYHRVDPLKFVNSRLSELSEKRAAE